MRYSSSKAYVESGGSIWGPQHQLIRTISTKNNNSYKQYKESNSNISNRKSSNTVIHYTKNGTLDMRFKTSKDLIYTNEDLILKRWKS